MTATCTSCGARIVWAKTENDKAIPIDYLPVTNGNVDLVADADPREPPTAFMLDKAGFRSVNESTRHSPFLRYQSHFASCAFADHHRKQK